jgi:hypothetical protein
VGYLDWNSRFIQGSVHLDGVEWTDQGIPLSMEFSEVEGEGPFIIPTASGEHVIQEQFAGMPSSDNPSRMMFQLPVQLFDENVYRRLLMAKHKGTVVNFVPHLWEMEHFAGAQVADVFSLSRPVAWTVASGVSSGTHPAVFYKDGVIDSDCASLGGTLSQELTVAEAGDIAVWYIPLFKVLVTGVSSQFEDVNGVVANVTLEEVRRYA